MSFGIKRCFGFGILGAWLVAMLSPAAPGQNVRGPRDYLDSDSYGHHYRDQVFDDDPYHEDHSLDNSRRGPARQDAEDDKSFSQAYPYAPPTRARRAARAPVEQRPFTRPANRYRDNGVRNDYAGVPVQRHYYGGEDRYDAPGYLDDAGRASALSNGYSRRGVEEFTGGYGGGVRLDDVYPLKRDVNPRRYRGRMLNGEVSNDDEDFSGANEVEDFVRSELSVRPGANLRVSSTGTYSYRNYIDQGNQVHARFRQPIHKKWQFGRGP
jgi:hypothetical protein